MNKLIVIISLLCVNQVFAQQEVYKCNIKGKTVYSNDEKDKNCHHIEIKEINVLNSPKIEVKEPEEKQVDSKLDNISNEKNSMDNLQKKKEIQEKVKKMEEDYLNNLEKTIRSLGG